MGGVLKSGAAALALAAIGCVVGCGQTTERPATVVRTTTVGKSSSSDEPLFRQWDFRPQPIEAAEYVNRKALRRDAPPCLRVSEL